MKKLLTSFLVFLLSATLLLGINAVAHAAGESAGATSGQSASGGGSAETPGGVLDEIIGGSSGNASGLNKFENRVHPLSSVDPGADVITSVIFTVIDFFKYIVGGIAVIYVIVSGIKLITATNKIDEVAEKEKENIKYVIYGLILIITADELVTKVFFGDYGECIASASNAKECAKVGGSLVKGIYSLVLAIMATVAVFILVLASFRVVTSMGEEETITKQKKRIVMSIIGLLIAGLGEFVIKGVVFPDNGAKGINVAAAEHLVYNFTNFIAAFIGIGAFGVMFYGGYLYVVSAGNEEQTGKAKKIIINAIIGILIALAAFGVVTTLTTFSTGREKNSTQKLPGAPGGPPSR